MGATMGRPSQMAGVAHTSPGASASNPRFGVGLVSSPQEMSGFVHESTPPPLVHDMMIPSATSSFDGSFEDAFGSMLASKREGTSAIDMLARNNNEESSLKGGGKDDGLTRDFLGLTAFSHSDILNLAGLDPSMRSSYKQPQQAKEPWHG